jgi:predicted dehydrogenase
VGSALACPQLKAVGDIDSAIVDLVFQSGGLGVVELSRNAAFGYDIRGEIWGTKGSIQIGYLRQTPILTLTADGVTHDAVPYFVERFEGAYLRQLQNFVDHVKQGLPRAVTGTDAEAALRISLAANLSLGEGRRVSVREAEALGHRS